MGLELYGDWTKARKKLRELNLSLEQVIGKFLYRETQILRAHILDIFKTQGKSVGWKPLSKWTLAMRRFKGFRGTSILQQSGQLRNSIITKVEEKKLQGFVGVLYSTRGAGGRKMVNIAQVQEFGSKPIARKMSAKQRRFLALVGTKMGLFKDGGGGGGGVSIIRIPPRPFMRPGAKEWSKGLENRAKAFFAQHLGVK